MPNLKFIASIVPEIWKGSHNFKSRPRDPFTFLFDVISHFSKVPPVLNLSMKFVANIFIGNRYMAILRLCRFGCEMPIPAHFGEVFFGVWPCKCSRILSIPPKGISLIGNTRFSALMLPIGQEMRPGRVKKEAGKRKKEKKKNSKIWQVTYLPRPPTLRYTSTKVVMWGGVPDVVNQFHQNRFRGFGSPRGRNLPFFYAWRCGLYNRLGLPPNLWSSSSLMMVQPQVLESLHFRLLIPLPVIVSCHFQFSQSS